MDFDNMVSLSDFARERDVDKQVITVYINRHPEIKEHVHYDTYNKNAAYLDDEAVKLLSKKYRMTTQIITDNELYEQVITCNNKMLTVADMMMAMMSKMDERMSIEMKTDDKLYLDLVEKVEKQAIRIKELEDENAKLREMSGVVRVELSRKERLSIQKTIEVWKNRMKELSEESDIYKNLDKRVTELETVLLLGKPI